jgi:hypothetical protein
MPPSRSPPSPTFSYSSAFPERSIQNFNGPVDLVGRHDQGRGDAPHGSALGAAADVYAQPVFEALLGRQPTELTSRTPAVAIGYQFDSEKKSHSSDITDLFILLLRCR